VNVHSKGFHVQRNGLHCDFNLTADALNLGVKRREAGFRPRLRRFQFGVHFFAGYFAHPTTAAFLSPVEISTPTGKLRCAEARKITGPNPFVPRQWVMRVNKPCPGRMPKASLASA
jgi:hypothetical protein